MKALLVQNARCQADYAHTSISEHYQYKFSRRMQKFLAKILACCLDNASTLLEKLVQIMRTPNDQSKRKYQ